MLQFAHPAYLWGALAVSVPILVHLFNRRRPRPLPFGAIEFVLRSQKQKSRKLRLRQLILLALRCLLVLGVALALARPSIVPKDAQAATLLGPQATALVLDASLSMRAHDGDQVLFESARAEALAALDHLMPEEPATAVICAGTQGAQGQIAAPSFDRVAVRRQLSQAQAGFVAGDLTACLTQAAKALAASPVPGKRIIAFSDLAAHGFRLSAPPPLVPASPEAPEGKGVRPNVVLVDATRQHELPNVSVTGVSVQPAPRLGPRGYEVSALISNFSTQALSGAQVVLRIGGQVVAKGFVDLPAHGSAKKTLGALLPPGLQAGRIELTPRAESGLDDDDGQDFLVQVPRDLKVLIVDGAPASLRTRDEAWFVEAALAPQRSAGRMIPTVLDAGAVEGK
ncbi:MAG: BatA and WFA domain-containing protein, partial [Deltaproteobacteria bacterium]|nr:BatA and WFA domain-containing protein [Deltaproteobacteria bacterium]